MVPQLAAGQSISTAITTLAAAAREASIVRVLLLPPLQLHQSQSP